MQIGSDRDLRGCPVCPVPAQTEGTPDEASGMSAPRLENSDKRNRAPGSPASVDWDFHLGKNQVFPTIMKKVNRERTPSIVNAAWA